MEERLDKKPTSTNRVLKRHFSLTDLPNVHKVNPFKIAKTSNQIAPTSSSFLPSKLLTGAANPESFGTSSTSSSSGGRVLKRSNSLNPFSLNKLAAKSASRASLDNPFNMLGSKRIPAATNGVSIEAKESTHDAQANSVQSSQQQLAGTGLEKENIPPEDMESKSKKNIFSDSSSSDLDDSDDSEEGDEGPSSKKSPARENNDPNLLQTLSSTVASSVLPSSEVLSTLNLTTSRSSTKPKDIEIERDHLPIDWSLKKSVTISSTRPLDWIGSIANSKTGKLSLSEKSSPAHGTFDASRINIWSAFTTPMPPSHAQVIARLLAREATDSSLTKKSGRPSSQRKSAKVPIWTDVEKAEYAFFKDREDQWKKSFLNAYRRVKSGDLSYLSYTNSLFSMVFVNIDGTGMKGLMSQSSPGFRLLLNEEEIEYDLLDGNGVFCKASLLANAGEGTDDLDQSYLEGFEDLIKKHGNSESANPPHALLFRDARACHAIFDLLLNWTDSKVEVRAQGPPKLLSNGPFLGASLWQCSSSKPVFVIQGDKKNVSNSSSGYVAMKLKTDVAAKAENESVKEDNSSGLWSVTLKNGNVGLCPIMIRDLLIFAADNMERKDENGDKIVSPTEDELRCVFENDSHVSAFKGGNAYEGTICVRSCTYSSGKFRLNLS